MPQPQATDHSSGFDEFWSTWPPHKRKTAKPQCRSKWITKGCAAIKDRVIASLKRQIASEDWRKSNGEYIPAPLVWLNQERWDVETDEEVNWDATRSGVIAMGIELGLGPWDEYAASVGRGEPFAAYERRVKAAHKERS